jgi:uncharacterized protein YegJ (DUF2314 family)
MTLYLDPLSDRISSATAAERDRARSWGRANNPFLLLNRASRFALDGEAGEVGNMPLLLLFGAGSAVWLIPAYVALHPWFTSIVIVSAIALLTYLGVPARLLRRIRRFPSVHDVLVEPGDPDMARSIERSMSEFSRFEEGLADESKQAFVKFRVEIDAGQTEHIWGFAHAIEREFVAVSLEEEEFDVPVAEVEDWLLIDEQGRREGGYTHLALARIYRKRYGTVPKEFLRELESFIDIRPTEYAQL